MQTITLTKPLKRGEETITEIVLREPEGAGELRGIKLIDVQQGDVATILLLTKRLTTTPLSQDEINRIGPADLCKLTSEITDFFTA
ncbi:MAG: phage tail assembly protein [Rhodospirillaceae bacterium]|nr:phage tail assembly protein [Rhodospirillales bacterium]